MIVETIRTWTDWLKDPTYGVNAQLANVPKDAGDPVPTNIAFIGDQTRDKVVAQWKEPQDFPALYVTMDGPAVGAGEVGTIHRDYDSVVVAIRYLVRNPDAEEALRDTFYTLRAIVRSVKDLAHNDQAPQRTRNGIYIGTVKSIAYGQWREGVGNATATGVVTITQDVRDSSP